MIYDTSQYEQAIHNPLTLHTSILKLWNILLESIGYSIFQEFSKVVLNIGTRKVPLHSYLNY